MTTGFGFTGGDGEPEPNPLAGFGEMLQSLGRFLSDASSTQPQHLTAATLRQAVSPHMPSHRIVDEQSATAVAAAGELANQWVGEHTSLSAAAPTLHAWSPQEWLEATAAGWVQHASAVMDAAARTTADALSVVEHPEDPSANPLPTAPLRAMAASVMASMMTTRLAEAVARLAAEVTHLHEIPADLSPGHAAVLPHAVEQAATDFGVAADQLLLWCALREVATARLFASQPWLNKALTDAVAGYAASLRVDKDKISAAAQSLDPADLAAAQEAMASGDLQPKPQGAGLMYAARVESLTTLITAWVDVVVRRAAGDRLPSAAALAEVGQRRRLMLMPSGELLDTIINADAAPKRLRTAQGVWDHITTKHGVTARDSLWNHPDLLPTSDDLSDPTDFLAALAFTAEPQA